MPERSDTLVRDRLARQRTELANERTLLSYSEPRWGFSSSVFRLYGGWRVPAFKRWVWYRWSRACCSWGSGSSDSSPSRRGSIDYRASCVDARLDASTESNAGFRLRSAAVAHLVGGNMKRS